MSKPRAQLVPQAQSEHKYFPPLLCGAVPDCAFYQHTQRLKSPRMPKEQSYNWGLGDPARGMCCLRTQLPVPKPPGAAVQWVIPH